MTDIPHFVRMLLGEQTPKSQPEVNFQEFWKEFRKNSSYIDKPVKKKEATKKPLNVCDRLNALIRIPEVQRELKAIEKEASKAKKEKLTSGFFQKYKALPELLEHLEFFSEYQQQERYFNWDTMHVFSNFEKSDPYFISKYRDGKHIIIAVDMTKKNKDIMGDFGQTLKRIRESYKIPKDKTRDKDTVQDIWKIYDYHIKDKMNFVQIARKISGIKGNPTYNPKLDAYRKQVNNAYKKAVDIIRRIRKKDD